MIIDGKKLANEIKQSLRKRVENLKKKSIIPKLAIILVGEDPASKIYINMKMVSGEEVGIKTELHKFPENFKEKELIKLIKELNKNKKIHAILVQLPLPKHINENRVIETISPEKDVDGLTSINMSRLLNNEEFLVPCTPKGIIKMLDYHKIDLIAKNAVVVGRSRIVGKPMALMLLNRNATVTVCHSRTKYLKEHTKKSDLLVVAVGKPKLITKDMVKEGVVVVDVGINRVEGKVCGDVDFENVKDVASYITPVPGGVGPMTVAMVLENTIIAAESQK